MGDSKIHRDDLERVIQEHERAVRERLEALQFVPVDQIATELGIPPEMVRAYAERAGISLVEAPKTVVNPFVVETEAAPQNPFFVQEETSPGPAEPATESSGASTSPFFIEQEASTPDPAPSIGQDPAPVAVDSVSVEHGVPDSDPAPANPSFFAPESQSAETPVDPERPRWNSLLLIAACTFALVGAGALLRSVWIETRPERPVYIGEGAARTLETTESRPLPNPVDELEQAQRNRDGLDSVQGAPASPDASAPALSEEEWERARERAAEFAERALERVREEQEAATRESEMRRVPRIEPAPELPESPAQNGGEAPEGARDTPAANDPVLPEGPG